MVTSDLRKKLRNILKQKLDFEFEADIIITHVINLPKSKWLLKDDIPEKFSKECLNLAQKRKNGEPLQYLLGTWEFYGVPIKVGRGVLIPRPETETVVDAALGLAKKTSKILDLCAGSGCVSAAIAKNLPSCSVSALELSDQAIQYAKKNLANFKNKVKIFKMDVLDERSAENFRDIDIIVCNPPYLTMDDMKNLQEELKHEPKMALFGGKDGLLFYKKIANIWKKSLAPNGFIIFEIGHDQKALVEAILIKNGYINTKTIKDLGGKDRVVLGQKPPSLVLKFKEKDNG